MLAGHDGADPRLPFRHGRKGNSSGLEQLPGKVHRGAAVPNDDGRDGSFAGGRVDAADIESGVGELLFEISQRAPSWRSQGGTERCPRYNIRENPWATDESTYHHPKVICAAIANRHFACFRVTTRFVNAGRLLVTNLN